MFEPLTLVPMIVREEYQHVLSVSSGNFLAPGVGRMSEETRLLYGRCMKV